MAWGSWYLYNCAQTHDALVFIYVHSHYQFCLKQVSSLGVSAFFVENISELQLTAMKLVTTVSILILSFNLDIFAMFFKSVIWID